MNVLFAGGGTGGHLYPGLAIARALVRLEPEARPFFVGARRGLERTVLPHSGFDHLLLDLHPLYRRRPWMNVATIATAGSALSSLSRLRRELRPKLTVGTGGYASALVLARAALAREPLVLQEQNSYPGATTRLFCRWAREVYLGFPEAQEHLRSARSALLLDTGNPIEPPPEQLPDKAVARGAWDLPEGGAVLLVTGGSQGSAAVNAAVRAALPRLLEAGIRIIWSTGQGEYEQLRGLESAHVRVRPFISPMAGAYAAADLALCRSGAMTIAELCAWRIPSVLIPLPTAAADHQTMNAKALDDAGAALMLQQAALNADTLADAVCGIMGDAARLAAMGAAASARARASAAADIAGRILAIMRSR